MCEIPEFYQETRPRARKPYRCDVCGIVIPKGVRHVAAAGKWDGLISTHRVHLGCMDLLDVLAREYDVDCVTFGREALEDARECGLIQWVWETRKVAA